MKLSLKTVKVIFIEILSDKTEMRKFAQIQLKFPIYK